jgi:hypothetical protein
MKVRTRFLTPKKNYIIKIIHFLSASILIWILHFNIVFYYSISSSIGMHIIFHALAFYFAALLKIIKNDYKDFFFPVFLPPPILLLEKGWKLGVLIKWCRNKRVVACGPCLYQSNLAPNSTKEFEKRANAATIELEARGARTTVQHFPPVNSSSLRLLCYL